jgi:menaquinone reductase, multiheme cytochrome c subunit
MKKTLGKSFLALVLVWCAVFLDGHGSSGAGGVDQYIAFNHKLHVDNGLACVDCHTGVLKGIRAGRPTIETCLGCHSEALTQSAEEEKIRQFAREARQIPWRRLESLPSHVYFSHRRHAGLAKIECEVCHGAMSQMTEPPRAPLVAHPMSFCLDCHNRSAVSVDCLACHR